MDNLRTIAASAAFQNTLDSTAYSSIRINLTETIKLMFQSTRARVEYMPMAVLVALYVSGVNSMRISEVLGICRSDYLGAGRFVIRAKKRSRSYTIYAPELRPMVEGVGGGGASNRIFDFDYQWVWAWCRRCGVGMTPVGHRNVARTHAHRYITAQKIAGLVDDGVAGDVLHHRSPESISYYLNERKGRNGKNQFRHSRPTVR